jgi:hypothetical protein
MSTTINNPQPSYVYAGGGGGGGGGGIGTMAGGGGNLFAGTITTANTVSPTLKIGGTGQLTLLGDDADLVINGVSLNETLRAIQTRLNILIPNPALEAEWDELKELGELYRRKETELKEKQRMWEIMKQAE